MAVTSIASVPFVGYVVKRWWERPRLRVKVRDDGTLLYPRDPLVFEATNAGGRPTSLGPAVRLRARVLRVLQPRFWYPDFLERFLTRAQIERWRLYVPIERRTSGRFVDHFDLEGEGDQLRLEPHGGARTFRGKPRYPQQYKFLVFKVLEFRQEGKSRPHRVRMPGPGTSALPAAAFLWAKVRYAWTGLLPGCDAPLTSKDFEAERRARD